jgi:hypothetical protein
VSRLVAAGLGLGLLVLLWLAVLSPLSRWRDQIALESQRFADERARLATSLVDLGRESADLSSGVETELIWSAPQMGEVNAMIQVSLSNIARESDIALRSITPLPPVELAGTAGVGFRLELEAPLDRLMDFLVAIESHSPALRIEVATLRRLTNLGETSDQPVVFAQIDIVAPIVIIQGDRT